MADGERAPAYHRDDRSASLTVADACTRVPAQPWSKRAFDVTLSILGLIPGSLIIALLALAIRRDSRGPAIFRQRRVGRGGAVFHCLKLRTMQTGLPDLPTHESKTSDVTRLGRHLRRWKLDELPQLFNVLRGEMSFVGPRPCLPSQTVLVEERRRLGVLTMRPGITGIAQVRGIDMSDPHRLAEVDALYIGHESMTVDLGLLARTFTPSALADRIGL
ncbi:sugar transferase [Pararhizobium mangrovi]|uniref:Sugar transferase n=1 Tax=Pararhizobium mangrovi TaxID=2590452 RepID=A0A506UCW8_9HYPH|nr:sugar transferase [Pararhizobium mangrovi]TPW30645.1 sugar transferase [Pararhizobium mangrovi]